MARDGGHSGGGAVGVGPPVCRDPVGCVVQVSGRRLGVAALPQAMPCCGVDGDGENHLSLGAKDAPGWSHFVLSDWG